MDILRTPDECFAHLADYPFEPHYTIIETNEGTELRIHHLDEGPKDGPTVLLMHGQPVWSYLYRKMIPLLVRVGMRVIAPDLPGYGKSDKPAAREDYSYQRQVDWMDAWLTINGFSNITFFGQDWGGLIGLRMIVDQPERFARIVIANTGLPYSPSTDKSTVDTIKSFREHAETPTLIEMQKALSTMGGSSETKFAYWQKFCWETQDLPIGLMMSMMIEPQSNLTRAVKFMLFKLGIKRPLPTDISKAYEAPFPDKKYKMGPRAMPSHVPTIPDESLEAQRLAWEFFSSWDKPFLCTFADDDPVTQGVEEQFYDRVPGTKNMPHRKIKGGGHFVQENSPEQVVSAIVNLIENY